MPIDYLPPPQAEFPNPTALIAQSAPAAAGLAAASFGREGSALTVRSASGSLVRLDGFFAAEARPSVLPEWRPVATADSEGSLEAAKPPYQTKLELVDGGSNTFSFLVEDKHGKQVTDGCRLRAYFSEGGEFFAVSRIEQDGKIVVELFPAAFDALADGEFATGNLTVLINGEEYFVPLVINDIPAPGQAT